MNLQKSIIFTIDNQFEPRHDVAHLQYYGYEVEYLLSCYQLFMNLEKSIIIRIFQRFEQKHDVAHLQYLLYSFAD